MKHDLIAPVARAAGFNQTKIDEIIESVLDEIVSLIDKNGACRIHEFGTFRLKQHKTRKVYDQKTLGFRDELGHFYITFTPGSRMKNMFIAKRLGIIHDAQKDSP